MGRFRDHFPFMEAALGLSFVVYATMMATSTYWALFLWTCALSFVYGWIQDDLRSLWMKVVVGLTIWLGLMWFLPFSINPNAIGILVALGIASSLVYGFWWYLPIGFVHLLILGSRGAILAAGMAGLVWLWPRQRLAALALALLTAALIVWFHREAGIYQRVWIWQDTINNLTLWGKGLGAFYDGYAQMAVKTAVADFRAQHTYNDFLELVYELGLGTIPLWIILLLALEGERPSLIVVTALTASLVYFPLHIVGIAHLTCMALGHLAASRVRMKRNHTWLVGV